MQNKRIYGLFILVCTVFGSTFLSISLGLKAGASPLFFAALRFACAGGIMLLALWVAKRLPFYAIGSLAGRAMFFSLFMTVGTFGCMFMAQTRVDSGFMARLDATGPLVTALFAALLLRKKMAFTHAVAFVLGTTGTFLIASPAARAETPYLIVAAGSVLFYGAGNVLYPMLFSEGEDPVLISALQAFFGGLILMMIALPTETIHFPLSATGPFLYLVLCGSIIGHTAALVLVRDAGPVFASGWLYVSPVIATVLGALVLGESISASGVLGTVVALAGVFVLGRAERGKARI
jgi:drug/metabolite transporter (DMT)-like permease